jgi:hypothetical protein
VSFITGTQMETLFAGPNTYQAAGTPATAGWVQVAGAVTTIQNLMVQATGASGAGGFVQPTLGPFLAQAKPGSLAKIIANGVVSWVATASTTATFSFGVTTATQAAATGAAAGTPITLITSQAYPNNTTAQTNISWRFELDLLVRQVGIGTTAVSTAILTTGVGGFTAATNANSIWGPLPSQVVTTVDTTSLNYLWAAVTFGTNASASNTCTMLDMLVFGCN